jgi:hypothetical protein
MSTGPSGGIKVAQAIGIARASTDLNGYSPAAGRVGQGW